MAGRKRTAPAESNSPRTTRASTRLASQGTASRPNSSRRAAGGDAVVPEVVRRMLVQARPEISAQNRNAEDSSSERPLKRRRPGEGRRGQTEARKDGTARAVKQKVNDGAAGSTTDDEDVQFEDVALPAPTVQTMERDSDEEEDDEIDFEDVAIETTVPSASGTRDGSKSLNLDLSAHMASLISRRPDRRKALSREEKERRVEVHKMHLVCLLAHVELRNRWCNDRQVQDALRPLLSQKTVSALIPRASLNQFGRSESLKKGLQEAKELFRMKFAITERGLRRALWAEDEEQLRNVRRSLAALPDWANRHCSINSPTTLNPL